VVTGVGLVTPVGTGVAEPWEALLAGESGIGPITRFDAGRLRTRFAGEVAGFDPLDFMDRRAVERTDRFIRYAIGAAVLAMGDAGLDGEGGAALPVPPERAATSVGVGIGGLERMEAAAASWYRDGASRFPATFIPQIIPNMAAGQVAIRYGLKGPCLCPATACASGLHAIGDGLAAIRQGRCDLALCGGAESTITPLAIGGFSAMRALSTRNDDPARACRPFDRARDGFVMGEGAGLLVLEALETAEARGARVYAELVGWGAGGEGHHVTAPEPEGQGALRAMRHAVEDAGLPRAAYGYVNAHGTSTPHNDYNEVVAIRELFGEHATELSISSTKSAIGHLLGAAGGVEAAATALALHHGVLPPTLNFERADDPERPDARWTCDPAMDYVPNRPRRRTVEAALCNSFGFGGTNASLALRRWEE